MKITIIPHNTSRIRNLRINRFVVIFLAVIIIFPITARFFLPRGFLNSNKIEETNRYLENSLKNFQKQYHELNNYYGTILSKVESVKRFDVTDSSLGRGGNEIDIDVLLGDLRGSRRILKKIEEKFSTDDKLTLSIPCVLPSIGYIIQTFGKSKYIFTGEKRFCPGIDIATPEGSVVSAAGSGRVEQAGFDNNSGLTVRIDHGYGFKTLYSHLALLKVGKGQFVTRGQTIGYVGKTGKTVGPRLHFEVWVNEEPKNPLDYIIQEVRYF